MVAVPAGTAAAGQLTGKATGRHELAEPRRGGAEGRRGAEERRAEERPFLELVARCVAQGRLTLTLTLTLSLTCPSPSPSP